MVIDLTDALAAERRNDRARLAREQRLAALARCCRPTVRALAVLHVRRLARAAVALRLPARAPQAQVCCA